MKPWNVIKALESNNSRLAKEEVIRKAAEAECHEFFDGARMALAATITFGVKKVPIKQADIGGENLSWGSFYDVAFKLTERALTGHAATEAIADLMNRATVEQWNFWYRRILIKDLRCGASETTINKVLKGRFSKIASIPVFSCQLAHDGANHEEKVSGKKMIEIKLDGVRVLTIVHPNGTVNQFSRNGKELLNFSHVKNQFAAVASSLKEPTVFDGEIMSDSFQDLMTQVHRKSNVNAGDAVLYLFDIIPLKDFLAGKCKKTQEERTKQLTDWFADKMFLQLVNVRVLEHEIVDLDTAAGQKEFKRINKQALAGGYEGIMIKDLKAPYVCKRSVSWLKQKPFIEVSLEVIDVEEGTGRNAGRMGALVCEGTDDGKLINVNVGSGYSDDQRDNFWIHKKKIKGMIAEIRADVVTQNRDGSYSLRFPRFLRFRGFKAGEKL